MSFNSCCVIPSDFAVCIISNIFCSTHITSDLDKIADMLIMIDNGKIVFQEEKDILLDSYRIVKGDIKDLNIEMEKLFMNIDKTIFGFTAITKYADEIKKIMPNCIIERPTIEDIMCVEKKTPRPPYSINSFSISSS